MLNGIGKIYNIYQFNKRQNLKIWFSHDHRKELWPVEIEKVCLEKKSIRFLFSLLVIKQKYPRNFCFLVSEKNIAA